MKTSEQAFLAQEVITLSSSITLLVDQLERLVATADCGTAKKRIVEVTKNIISARQSVGLCTAAILTVINKI